MNEQSRSEMKIVSQQHRTVYDHVQFRCKCDISWNQLIILIWFVTNIGLLNTSSIKDIMHERAWLKSDVFSTQVYKIPKHNKIMS